MRTGLARVAVSCKDVLGESPIWHAREQALYWIDVAPARLHRFDPRSGEHLSRELPKPIGSIVERARGGLVCVFRAGLAFLDRFDAELEWFTPAGFALGEERLNDGKCDRRGRLWVAGMDRNVKQAIGKLYRLDPDLGWHAVETSGFTVGNGPCWSPDDRAMYANDSPARTSYRYDFDVATGRASNRRPHESFAAMKGRPDGATVDSEGGHWIAEVHGHRIVRFTPDGALERAVDLPVERPTSVCFGGPDYATMYITTSTLSLTEESLATQPLAGALFAVEPGVRGLAEVPFAG